MRLLALLLVLLSPSWAQVGVPIGPSSPADLTPVERGARLWLRADAGVQLGVSNLVETWEDQSGNDHHAVQELPHSRPLFTNHGLNGQPGLQFDGDDTLLIPSFFPLGNYTEVVVFSLDDLDANNSLVGSDGGHALFFTFEENARLFHTASIVVSNTPTVVGETVILTATYSAATGIGRLFQDGTLVGEGPLNPHNDKTLIIGGYAGGGFLRGTISEVQIYDRLLREDEQQAVEQDLASRYTAVVVPRVEFAEIPLNGRIVQRDENDQGTVRVSGFVQDPGVDKVEVDLILDGQLVKTTKQLLQYIGDQAPFLIDSTLDAGLLDYELDVWTVSGSLRQRIAQRRNLACGDLFLINGQSNAVAGDFQWEGLGNTLQSNWIRTYGTANSDPALESTDRHWDLADGELWNQHACIGQLGIQLSSKLVNTLQVPIGVINGAENGTSVLAHQRNDAFPADLNTIYGRLFNRAQRGYFANDVRWMVWYQGEKDSGATENYVQDFTTLYEDWFVDYPSLEQIYLIQVRAGCDNDLVKDGIREVQRNLPKEFPRVKLMSSTAVDGHDGCHFGFAGHGQLAERIERLVLRDFHGSLDTDQIKPPQLEFALWVDSNQESILLSFEDRLTDLVLEPGAESDFLLSDGTQVENAMATGNLVLLILAAPSTAATVSYVGHPEDGPFLRNSRGVGALTFFEVPIQE